MARPPGRMAAAGFELTLTGFALAPNPNLQAKNAGSHLDDSRLGIVSDFLPRGRRSPLSRRHAKIPPHCFIFGINILHSTGAIWMVSETADLCRRPMWPQEGQASDVGGALGLAA